MSKPRIALMVKDAIDEMAAHLIESGIVDDANFSMVSQSGLRSEVTFTGAEHVSLALGVAEYSDIYRELAEKRSFNMRLLDGGILQVMYRFEKESLVQHRLAYFPSPSLRPFQDDPESYMRDDLFVDIVTRRMVPFPIRFDFDGREGKYKDVSHPRSHLTLGDLKGCRLPVTAPLTPRWFVEFILRNFYQSDKHDLIGGLPAHRFHFSPTISANEQKLIHLTVPSLAA